MDLLHLKAGFRNVFKVYFQACLFVSLIAVCMLIKFKLIVKNLEGKITTCQCGPVFVLVEAQDFIATEEERRKASSFFKISAPLEVLALQPLSGIVYT